MPIIAFTVNNLEPNVLASCTLVACRICPSNFVALAKQRSEMNLLSEKHHLLDIDR